MYTISKRFSFSAAHHLDQLPEGHKCKRQHGHNYVVTVILAARDLDKNSFVMDYGDLAPIKQWIDGTLDHRDLNEIFKFPPTAELIAKEIYTYFATQFPRLVGVVVSETDNTTASFVDTDRYDRSRLTLLDLLL